MKKRPLKKRKLRNAEYYDMTEVFDKLYQESQKKQTFNRLMGIIESPENIKLAYRNIRKNKGSKTAGADGKNIKDLDNWEIDRLVQHVQRKLKWYEPQKVKRVEIPKDDGGKRPLGIPSIMDRLIQQCILQVLEPICEAKFFKRSNGFRPNRSTEHAIAQAERCMQILNLHYVVDVDIKGFFDNVSHGKLLKQIWTLGIKDKRLICIISKMLKAEVVGIGFPEKGTPQGGIISPLLSNIVLNELDWWIVSQWEAFPTHKNYVTRIYANGTPDRSSTIRALRSSSKLKECYVVRYADDFKIFCKTNEDAIKMFKATTMWLKDRLGLDISPTKSKVVNLKREKSEFLGFELRVRPKGKNSRGEVRYVVKASVQPKKLRKIKNTCKEIIKQLRATYDASMEYKLIQKYNSYLIGVHNYYRIATNVNIDFQEIAFDVKKTFYNRMKHRLSKEGKITNKYIQEVYGKSKEVRYINNHAIVPIAYVQHAEPIDKKVEINKYTVEGRELIHKSLSSINSEIMHWLMKNTNGTSSVEYNDNRISLYVAQKGRCAITGKSLEKDDIDCHHKKPKKFGGGDEYSNLIIVSVMVHALIHATNEKTISIYLKELKLDNKQLKKVNRLRKLAEVFEIKQP